MQDFDLENQLATQRYQQALRAQQEAGQSPTGNMVGNVYVKSSPFEHLANVLRSYNKGQELRASQENLVNLGNARKQAIADALRGFQEKASGAPSFEAAGPAPQGQDQSGGYQVAARPADLKGAYASLLNAPTPELQKFGLEGSMKLAQQDAAKAQNQQYFDILSKAQTPQQALQAGVPFDVAKQYYESRNLGRDEVGRTVEVEGPNGQKMIQQLDKYGKPVGEAMPGYMQAQVVNQGNQITFAKPIAGQSFGVNMAPGEVARLGQAERHFQQSQNAPQFSAEAGGFVYKPNANAPQGGFVPTQGLPSKPLNDVQAKAVGFGTRMQNADAILNDLAKSGTNAVVPGAGNAAMNPFLSKNQQMAAQAQRDFVNAILRRESGAAISPSEFDSASKQYFPQVGDSPEVIAQKAQNRAIAIKGVQAEIPASHAKLPSQIIQSVKPQAGGIDALLEKYK